ncbi:MAG: carboxypeptidase regulatory-like domain-containing protein [Hyphomonadaceae bacterium]|nr:carboxypeptidase regulatory-like domain-containing protein [Hyphomonadaceae bacterium]
MMSKKWVGGAALSVLSFAMGGVAWAQETTAAMRGTVTDASGAPLAGVDVVAVHEPTGTRFTEPTAADGSFDLRGMRVGGPYSIEFTSPDYQGERVENVFLVVGNPYRIVVDLEPSEAEIVVTANIVRAGAEAIGSQSVLTRDDIDGVVSVSRDIRDLARRDPLVSQTAGGNQGLRIAGSNPRTNRITIDGVQAQDDFGLNTGGLPTRRGPVSLDAIETFQVEAVPFDVENGDFLGGAVNVTLAQGGNEIDGSAFVKYLNEGLVGTRLNGVNSPRLVTQENYGGTLRGPIIEDTLFYALSYEYYNSADVTDRGPANSGFANTITGPSGALTQAQIDAITGIYYNTYGGSRPLGGITNTKPIYDEKYTARVDWNINEDHRAFATYRYSESGIVQRTNLTQTSAGLDSQWYLTGEEDQTFAFQVNSDWSPNFSTEARYSQRDYTRLQEPPNGQNFADIQVCTSPTPTTGGSFNACDSIGVVRFGPDLNRHANFLQTQTQQAAFSGEYVWGDHLFKAGLQWQRTDVFNIFLPNSDGTYYFDSTADFLAGRANQYQYRNALTNNPNDAAAVFDYNIWTAFVQDQWDITPDLTLTAGIRYDAYAGDDKPKLNPNFVTRYGFDNLETYTGRDVIMPRIAAEWRPQNELKISGGIGLFSGGLPDVFLSNVYANTGFVDNSFDFRRNATTGLITENNGNLNCGPITAQAQACLDALNIVPSSTFGFSVPASVRAALANLQASPFGETNSISPDFEMPSDWRSNLSVQYERWGFDFGFDAIYVVTNEALAFRDLRATPLLINGQRALTPDGRIRYDGLNNTQRNAARALGFTVSNVQDVRPRIPVSTTGSTAGAIGNNRDIQAYNPGETSEYLTLAFTVSRAYDFGVDWSLSYALQNFDEYSSSARFASTANSLYNDQFTALDPDTPVRGEGLEEISNSWKGNIGWRRDFVGDLETRFELFGSWSEDRASTPVMGTPGGGRSTTFGVNRPNQIAYIPNFAGWNGATTTLPNDNRVVFESVAAATTVANLVRQYNLPQGRIAERGSLANDDIARFDLSISQELPALREGHRTLLTFEVQNLGNLINDEWGIIRTRSETGVRLFDVSCANAAGVANDAGQVTCERYRISNANTTGYSETLDSETSRWYIQIGLKYEF